MNRRISLHKIRISTINVSLMHVPDKKMENQKIFKKCRAYKTKKGLKGTRCKAYDGHGFRALLDGHTFLNLKQLILTHIHLLASL